MAKVHDMGIAPVAMIAGADLSASANRYKFVSLSTSPDKVIAATGASNPGPFGILQNSPCSGEEAAVSVLGFSKLIVDCGTCGLNVGNLIVCASDAQGEKQTNTGSVFAHALALEAVTTGSAIIEVMLLPFNQQVLAAS